MKAVIGALRAVLGLDSTAFEKGIGQSQKMVAAFNRDFQKMAKSMERAGTRISVGISAPAAAAKAVALKTAADFEEGMNRVQAATGATADEFNRLEAMARKVGAAAGFGATEASSAMEALAKNGLNVSQILGGAADATVKLAAANGAQLAPAADIVTDVMQQFGKSAADLQGVVDQVTGTLIASKFSFDDYRLAIGQAGGVAGKIGVKFEDFNAALAVTSSSFASGSDAGTSFKTFLTRLVPQSDEARKAMELLGLSFFDSKGNMVGMEEAAARLQKALMPLSQASRLEGVTKIFGTDAMRTALALAEQGAEGVKRMRQEIEKVSAADQAAVRLKGFNGAVRQLKSGVEALGIAIGKSGLLETATRWVTALTTLTKTLSELNPQVLKITSLVLGLAAALGPTLLIVSQGMKIFGSAAVTFSRMAPALTALVVAAAPLLGTVAIIGAIAGAIALFGDKITVFTSGNVAVSLHDVLFAIGQDFKTVGGWIGDAAALFGDGLAFIGRSIGDLVPGLGALMDKMGDVMRSLDVGDVLRRVFVDPIDFSLNTVVALITTTIVAFKTLGPAIGDLLAQLANIVGEKMTMVVNAAIEKLNWLREKIGNDPLPLLKWTDFENANKGAADKAGKAIAQAFAESMSGSIVQQTIDRLKAAGVGRAIAKQVQEQIDKATPGADFLGLNDPKGSGGNVPAPGGGGGRVLDFGGAGEGKKSATEKLKEFIDAIARESELLKMSNKLKAEAEALDKAEAIAKEGKIKLTDADTAAIRANVAAQLEAKAVADERNRLEALAKSTFEDTRTAQEKYTVAVGDLDKMISAGLITQDTYTRAMKVLREELGKHAEGLEGQLDQVSTAITDAAKDAAQELLNTDKSFGDILTSMWKRFSAFALQMFLFEPLFKSLGEAIKGAVGGAMGGSSGGGGGFLGGIAGGIGKFIGGLFGSSSQGMSIDSEIANWSSYGGARAGGGDVSPGRWYQVNERGIEAFVPDVPGKIMTHSELRDAANDSGGPPVVNQSIVIRTPDAGSFRRSTRQVQRQLKRTAGVV